MSSGWWLRVVWLKRTDLSEKPAASVNRNGADGNFGFSGLLEILTEFSNFPQLLCSNSGIVTEFVHNLHAILKKYLSWMWSFCPQTKDQARHYADQTITLVI
jgi:hypothetical protein